MRLPALLALLALPTGCSHEPEPRPGRPIRDLPIEDTGDPPIEDPVRWLLAQDAATAVLRGDQAYQYIGSNAALGDLTGDGVPDLAIRSGYRESPGTYLFRGPFEGDLTPGDAFAFLPYGAGGVGIGDINGDGHPDLALLRGPVLDFYEFQVYYGPLGVSPFQQPDAIVRPEQTGGLSGRMCDANLDGVADLVMTYPSHALRFAMGPLPARNVGEDALLVFERAPNLPPSPGTNVLCGHDLTGDGTGDLLFPHHYSPYHLWMIEDPPWEGRHTIQDLAYEIPAVLNSSGGALGAPGDLTGDGYLDLYTYAGLGQLVDGPLRPASQPYASFDWTHSNSSVVPLGDLDGDGFDDLVVGAGEYSTGGGVLLLFGPIAPGVYTPDDMDLVLETDHHTAHLGRRVFRDPASGLWGATAEVATDTLPNQGLVYLFSGWPGPP